ncbi:MAG: hypothetical protein ACREJ2_04485 [Planctomycetota bacterium]
MSYKLNVMPAFWSSEHVPKACVFSGRTDKLLPCKVRVSCLSDEQKAALVHGRALRSLAAAAQDNSLAFEVPGAPGQHAAANRGRGAAGLLAALFAAGLFGVALLLGLVLEWTLAAWLVGLLAVPGAFAAWLWIQFQLDRRNTRFQLLRPGGPIEIAFPNRLQETFRLYRDAYKTFLHAHGAKKMGRDPAVGKRRKKLARAPAPAPAPSTTDTADSADELWDEDAGDET